MYELETIKSIESKLIDITTVSCTCCDFFNYPDRPLLVQEQLQFTQNSHILCKTTAKCQQSQEKLSV